MNTKQEIKNHMSFLGYEVLDHNEDEYSILCLKAGYATTIIKCTENNIVLWSKYNINEIAKNNPADFLSYVNGLNCKGSVATFYVNEKGEFNFIATYAGRYDKQQVADFLSKWEYDTCHLVYSMPDLDRFFRNLDEVAQSSYSNSSAYA